MPFLNIGDTCAYLHCCWTCRQLVDFLEYIQRGLQDGRHLTEHSSVELIIQICFQLQEFLFNIFYCELYMKKSHRTSAFSLSDCHVIAFSSLSEISNAHSRFHFCIGVDPQIFWVICHLLCCFSQPGGLL